MRIGETIVTYEPRLDVFVPDDGGRPPPDVEVVSRSLPEEELVRPFPGERNYVRTAVFELVVESEKGVWSQPDYARVDVYRWGDEVPMLAPEDQARLDELAAMEEKQRADPQLTPGELERLAALRAPEWRLPAAPLPEVSPEDAAVLEARERLEADLVRERAETDPARVLEVELDRLSLSLAEWVRLDDLRLALARDGAEREGITAAEWSAREAKRLGLGEEEWATLESVRAGAGTEARARLEGAFSREDEARAEELRAFEVKLFRDRPEIAPDEWLKVGTNALSLSLEGWVALQELRAALDRRAVERSGVEPEEWLRGELERLEVTYEEWKRVADVRAGALRLARERLA